MSNLQNTQKTLEVKIRPYSNPKNHERADQKGAARVHLSREALYDLRLDPGYKCYLWKTGDDPSTGKEALAWLTPENSLNKKVIQISKVFQEAGGFKLGDDLNICAGAKPDVADNITLREIPIDVTAKDGSQEVAPELNAEELSHWTWYLKDYLCTCAGQIIIHQ